MILSLTSKYFVAALFLLVILFYLIKKMQKEVVILFSILFYLSYGKASFGIVLAMIGLSYVAGRLCKNNKSNIRLAFFIVISLLPLIFIKYIPLSFNIIEPVGISFIIFKIISFLVDVYRGDVRDFCFRDYLAYILFFPTVTSGPIDRYNSFSNQFKEQKKFDYERLLRGLFMMLYGYLMKLVIADRIAINISAVFDGYQDCGALAIFIAQLLYCFQIYFDFAGYSYIALGIAKLLGIDCMVNFKQPYFSKSIGEFWRRWHISLSSWLRDYVYIPLGGNKKGFIRKNINILIVFAVSGIWHGAGITFFLWGLIHGIFQVLDNVVKKFFGRTINEFCMMVITIAEVFFAWTLFRASSIREWIGLQSRIITKATGMGFIEASGISRYEIIILLVFIIICTVVDYLNYRTEAVLGWLINRNALIRGIVYYLLIISILTFGVYGSGFDATNFIYFNF